MNMSLIDVNEQVSLLEGLAKQPLERFEELGAFVSIRLVQQLAGFFPRQPQLLERLANGFTAALDSEVNCSPTYQPLQCPPRLGAFLTLLWRSSS